MAHLKMIFHSSSDTLVAWKLFHMKFESLMREWWPINLLSYLIHIKQYMKGFLAPTVRNFTHWTFIGFFLPRLLSMKNKKIIFLLPRMSTTSKNVIISVESQKFVRGKSYLLIKVHVHLKDSLNPHVEIKMLQA